MCMRNGARVCSRHESGGVAGHTPGAAHVSVAWRHRRRQGSSGGGEGYAGASVPAEMAINAICSTHGRHVDRPYST
jgi:hypothetical protein